MAQNGQILKIFWSELIEFGVIFTKTYLGPIPWQAAEIIGGLLATELQSDRVTDTQGYPVNRWVKFFCT